MSIKYHAKSEPVNVQLQQNINNSDSIELQGKTKSSKQEIENALKAVFQQYNKTYSLANVIQILGEEYTEEKLCSLTPFELDDALNKIESAFKQQNKQDEVTTITFENFEEAMVKKYAEINGETVDFSNIPDDFLAKHFKKVLAQKSDEQKVSLINDVINKFKNKPILVKALFDSIQDKNIKMNCADNVDSKLLMQAGYEGVLAEVTKHKSAPGTNKLFDELKNKLEAISSYEKNKNIIDKVYKNNYPVEKLTEDELKILNEYNHFAELQTIVVKSSLSNKNFTKEDTEQFINKANESFKDTPYYRTFLHEIAVYISDNKNSLNLSREELSEIFDKASNKEYSKVAEKIPDKSAIDSETGNFKKTAEQAEIQVIKQNIETSKQEIARNSEEESNKYQIIQDLPNKVKNPAKSNSGTNTSTFLSYNFENLKDIITGKIKNSKFVEIDENSVINKFSEMNTSEQILLLGTHMKGKYFRNFIKNAKDTTLKLWVDLGMKASSVDDTKFVIQVQQDNEKEKKSKKTMPS